MSEANWVVVDGEKDEAFWVDESAVKNLPYRYHTMLNKINVYVIIQKLINKIHSRAGSRVY